LNTHGFEPGNGLFGFLSNDIGERDSSFRPFLYQDIDNGFSFFGRLFNLRVLNLDMIFFEVPRAYNLDLRSLDLCLGPFAGDSLEIFGGRELDLAFPGFLYNPLSDGMFGPTLQRGCQFENGILPFSRKTGPL
jgi:hypothetical protein